MHSLVYSKGVESFKIKLKITQNELFDSVMFELARLLVPLFFSEQVVLVHVFLPQKIVLFGMQVTEYPISMLSPV